MSPKGILAALAAPFDPSVVSWRVGSTTGDKSKGMALAYVDARDVQARLDEVMGADWQCEYVPMPNGTCCCRIGLKIEGEWRWRSNGAGATDVEGEKGQYSDAFKRAAVLWGVGSYLYKTPSPWVQLEHKGRSQVIAPGQERVLAAALAKAGAHSAPPLPVPAPTPAAKVSPERQERIAAVREADPHKAVMLAVTRGSDPALSDDAPDPADDERPVPEHLLKTATATTVSVSAKLREEMLDALREVYTAKQLASWEKRYGKGSGKPDSLTRLDRDEVVKVWKLKQQAVKPNGAIGGGRA